MGAKKDENGRYYTDTLLRDIFEGEFLDPITNMKYNVRKVLNLSDEFFSFSNSQKPEGLLHLLQSIVQIPSGNYFMDFFAGSGSSIAVAKKLGNKFIGVELGEHFNTFYVSKIKYKNSPTNKVDIYKDFDVLELNESEKVLEAVVNKVGLLGRLKEIVANSGRHEPCGITHNLSHQIALLKL